MVVNGLAFVFVAESIDLSDFALNIFDQSQGGVDVIVEVMQIVNHFIDCSI